MGNRATSSSFSESRLAWQVLFDVLVSEGTGQKLKLREVAEKLGCSYSKVWLAVQNDALPYIRVGSETGNYLILLEDACRWAAQGQA